MSKEELRVLIIDDEEISVKAFSSKARKQLISLKHFKNFDDGLDELKRKFSDYDGVILDAKCFADRNAQMNNDLSEAHIDKVSNEVKGLTEAKGYIPYCIYTGYSGKFRERLEVQEFKVFAKPQDDDEVLNFIREHNELERKFYFENKEVMKIFKYGVLKPSYLKRLGESLSKLNSEDETEIKSTATLVREIIEDLLDLLNNCNVIPNDIRTDSINTIAIYLAGKKTDSSGNRISNQYKFDEYVTWSLSYLHTLTSQYLHSNENTNSKYVQSSLIYTLFELLDWFRLNTVKNLENN